MKDVETMSGENMARLKVLLIAWITCFLLLAACTQADSSTQPAQDNSTVSAEKVIVLGDISDDPGEVIEGTQPLADYLANQLADYGYTAGQVKVAASMEEMIQYLKNGEVDLYFDSAYPATVISDESGAHPFLRRWRFGRIGRAEREDVFAMVLAFVVNVWTAGRSCEFHSAAGSRRCRSRLGV